MARDVEDFLRRAAQRRAANAAAKAEERQREQQRSKRTIRPEYTDRNRERAPATADELEEEVYVAELAEDHSPSPRETTQQPPPAMEVHSEAAVRKLAQSAESAGLSGHTAYDLPPRSAPVPSHHGTPAPKPSVASPIASALVRLLTNQDGVRQAVLVREIMDRPTHRW